MDAPCHTYILRALAGFSRKMVEELTGRKLTRSAEEHLDPDLKASQLIDQRFTPPAASTANPNSTWRSGGSRKQTLKILQRRH
jgi:hypothetical protein